MTKILSFPRYFFKWYTLKAEIDRLLLLSFCFGTCLLAARMIYTGSIAFVFLEWNLFLAFLPYFISHGLSRRPAYLAGGWRFVLILATWLLFIPNSFYILTDLFHLTESGQAPRWVDLLLIFSFAWTGLLMGILSVRHMEKMVQKVWKVQNEWLFLYPVMWLNALGVFIGRYLRFNSWDVITNPFRLMIDICNILIHPLLYKNAWGMIFCFTIFMILLYLSVKRISRMIW